VSELSKIPGLKPYYSHGNYVLIDATDAGVTGKEICGVCLPESRDHDQNTLLLSGEEWILQDQHRNP